MEEIKTLLEKNDIAASIVLHTPGYSEYLMHLTTTYSCAKVEPNGIRLKAKLQEDFGGNKALWEHKIKETSGMLYHLGTVHAYQIMSLIELSKLLDKKVGAEHFGKGNSSHESQNN